MAEATRTDQPTYVDRKLTAQQFLDYFLNDIAAEANFTEENNEDRTLGDYLADLSARCERILSGEVIVTDPAVATMRPMDQWVTGGDVAAAVRDLCSCPDTDNSEYVRGAWETALTVMGLNDDAREADGTLGGPATDSALTVSRKIIPEKRGKDTATKVLTALGLDSSMPDWHAKVARTAAIIRGQEVEA